MGATSRRISKNQEGVTNSAPFSPHASTVSISGLSAPSAIVLSNHADLLALSFRRPQQQCVQTIQLGVNLWARIRVGPVQRFQLPNQIHQNIAGGAVFVGICEQHDGLGSPAKGLAPTCVIGLGNPRPQMPDRRAKRGRRLAHAFLAPAFDQAQAQTPFPAIEANIMELVDPMHANTQAR